MQIGSVTLHDHQIDAVERIHDGCVLQGGVGTGKTYTSLAYYALNHSDKQLLVITTAKKRDSFDWMKEARDIHLDPDRVTVDSWNNISNYTHINPDEFFIIFDEQRLVGTGVWTVSFWKMAKNNPWILLSATPGDTWSDYAPVFIANGYYKNITQFRYEHVIYARFSKFPKISGYFNEGKLRKLRNAVVVDMDVERHTVRHIETVKVEYDEELFDKAWKKRWNIYEDRPLKDAGELFRVARKIVGTDRRRLEMLKTLTHKHPKLVVFYNFDYELEMLRELSQDIPTAEWNGHKHENVPNTKQWLYLVQYNAGAEGWNCTSTDAMVFYSLTYSYKQYAQALGRIDRMNTPFVDLYYYVLMSDSKSCKAVWRALLKKKSFNTRGFEVKRTDHGSSV